MTEIIIEWIGVHETPVEAIDRRFWHMDCRMSIDGETIDAEWFECMDIITARFPYVEFTFVWTGHVCTLVPTGRHVRIVEDPTCCLFGDEIIW
jgi:hypothetical protein